MEQFSLVFDTRRLNTFPSFVVLFKTQSEFGMVSIESNHYIYQQKELSHTSHVLYLSKYCYVLMQLCATLINKTFPGQFGGFFKTSF